MLRDITIGQYFPGTSVVHRTDPRLKLVLVIAMIVTLFLASGPVSLCPAGTLYPVRHQNFGHPAQNGRARPQTGRVHRGLYRTFKPVLHPGTELWSFGFLHITDQGIRVAILMVVRILLLIIGTSMLTYTTSPIELTDGLEMLLSPFKKVHLPVHELAMMMSIALRFIPTLIEETEKIIAAQKARGADFESGNLIQRARAMVPILVPLFISGVPPCRRSWPSRWNAASTAATWANTV